jgi:hypothetical protein
MLHHNAVVVSVDAVHLDTGRRGERFGGPTKQFVHHRLLALEGPGPLIDAHPAPCDVLGHRIEQWTDPALRHREHDFPHALPNIHRVASVGLVVHGAALIDKALG